MSGLFGSPGTTHAPPVYSGLQVSTSQLDVPVAIFWGQRRLGTNAIDFADFQGHAVKGKGKGGGTKGSQPKDYTAAVILGLCEGPIDSIANVWASGSTTTTTTLSNLNMTLFTGTVSQAPWSFMTTKFPAKARAYAYTAYLACPKLDLGESATVPDNAFECVRSAGFSYTHSGDGWKNPDTGIVTPAIDCLLSDIIPDLLTNVQYGGYFSGDDIGPVTQFAAYQRAQGLFFSPLLSSQSKVTELLDRWAQLSNAWIFWSGTQLEFVPLGDAVITGNGVTFTPRNDVAYDLGPADFVVTQGEPPIKVTRKDPADCSNRTTVTIRDRTKGYVSNPVEYKDQTLIDAVGQRDDTSIQADEICDPAVGKIVAQLIGKRSAYIRKTYAWKSPSRLVRCLPGTILTLTEPNCGLAQEPVRVTSVKRGSDRTLSFEAEEFPGTVGTYVSDLATVAAAPPSVPNFYALPGNVNTPAIVEPDSRFGGNARIIIAASGGPDWGSCEVFLSFDGTNYETNLGTITTPAGQGVLTASLASFGGANPDTGHTLSVDCGESRVSLPAVTHADADALRSLALVAPQPTLVSGALVMPTTGELLSFGAVTPTGTYSADLTYLQRGAYGSSAGSHSSGDQFTAINVLGNDGTSISYPLPAAYIGVQLYLKFASINLFGLMQQDLSTVAEYKYTPTGAGYGTGTGGVPSTPTGLWVSDFADINLATWDANPVSDNVIAYSLYRADGTGALFGSAAVIWTGRTLGYTDNNILSDAAYTYFIVASNAVGDSSHSAGLSPTVSDFLTGGGGYLTGDGSLLTES